MHHPFQLGSEAYEQYYNYYEKSAFRIWENYF